MRNNVSNISFKSRFVFVPHNTYKRLVHSAETLVVKEMSGVHEVKKISQRAATDTIMSCVAGICTDLNEKISYIFHFFPHEIFSYENYYLTKNLEAALKKFSKTSDSKGFLIGGEADNQFSKRLIKLLAKPFKGKEENFTVFLSQEDNAITSRSAFFYDKSKDTCFVNVIKRDIKSRQYQNVLTLDEILNSFRHISVSADDEVFVLGKRVPNEVFDQRKIRN